MRFFTLNITEFSPTGELYTLTERYNDFFKFLQTNVEDISLNRPRHTSSKYRVIIYLIGIVIHFLPPFHFNHFKRGE
jgi:hypothetical protein